MVDLETATIRLYEEASLTEDLVDQDATMLLKWAEQQVADLVTKYGSDEEAFENAFSALRSMVKNMNRFVGQSAMSAEEQQAKRLENISQSAGQIGFELTPTFSAQSQSRGTQSQTEMLQSMLSSLQKTDSVGTAGGTAQPTGGAPAPGGRTASTVTASTGEASNSAVAQTGGNQTAGDAQSARSHQQQMTLQPSSSSASVSETPSETASDMPGSISDHMTDERMMRVFTVHDHDNHRDPADRADPAQTEQNASGDSETAAASQDTKPGLSSLASKLRDVMVQRHQTDEGEDVTGDQNSDTGTELPNHPKNQPD